MATGNAMLINFKMFNDNRIYHYINRYLTLPFKISICRCKTESDTSPFLSDLMIMCQRTGTMYLCLHDVLGTSWEAKPRSCIRAWWSEFCRRNAGSRSWGMSGTPHRRFISSPLIEIVEERKMINLEKQKFVRSSDITQSTFFTVEGNCSKRKPLRDRELTNPEQINRARWIFD